ncbi:hypothetical protein [Pseudanabaena cinerea]|nr:hypothetical protein [Pseudanabaena cinerea]
MLKKANHLHPFRRRLFFREPTRMDNMNILVLWAIASKWSKQAIS